MIDDGVGVGDIVPAVAVVVGAVVVEVTGGGADVVVDCR
jgi:hypothetical protein